MRRAAGGEEGLEQRDLVGLGDPAAVIGDLDLRVRPLATQENGHRAGAARGAGLEGVLQHGEQGELDGAPVGVDRRRRILDADRHAHAVRREGLAAFVDAAVHQRQQIHRNRRRRVCGRQRRLIAEHARQLHAELARGFAQPLHALPRLGVVRAEGDRLGDRGDRDRVVAQLKKREGEILSHLGRTQAR